MLIETLKVSLTNPYDCPSNNIANCIMFKQQLLTEVLAYLQCIDNVLIFKKGGYF